MSMFLVKEKVEMRCIYLLIFIALLCGVALGQGQQQTIYTVDDSGGADYTSIQDAIDACSDGDKVSVYDGTYNENIEILGKTIIVESVNGPLDCTIVGDGTTSVVRIACLSKDPSLEGFTITNGVGYDSFKVGYKVGGGIFVYTADRYKIEDCVITGNEADYGGGVYIFNAANGIFKNNTVSSNEAFYCGGGIFAGSVHAVIELATPGEIDSNIIEYNEAPDGGGACIYGVGDINFISNNIRLNTAKNGAGLYIQKIYSLLWSCVTDNEIHDNIAYATSGEAHGSGVYIKGYTSGDYWLLCLKFERNLIYDNTREENTTLYGGGMYITDVASYTEGIYPYRPYIRNNIICSNGDDETYKAYYGGGIYFVTACTNPLYLFNNTIADNDSFSSGAGMYVSMTGYKLYIMNTILWNSQGSEIYYSTTEPIITYSCIMDGYSGTGNVSTDPEMDSTYHLTADSDDCIDGGLEHDGSPCDDIDGDTRDRNPDMGADEYIDE